MNNKFFACLFFFFFANRCTIIDVSRLYILNLKMSEHTSLFV